MEYSKHKKGYRLIAWLLFGLYIILMVYFLFFAESMGRNLSREHYHYNENPFGNVLAFVPFGLFFPLLSRKNRGFWKVTLISFEVSLLVELIQLVTRVGSCDVDDMILNTLGGMSGWLCFKIMWNIQWKNGRELTGE